MSQRRHYHSNCLCHSWTLLSRANNIASRDPCDECSPLAALGKRWPFSKPGSPGPASSGYDRPVGHAPRMQVEDHGKIKPPFARPDIGDVTCPFLVRVICNEVPIPQVGRNVEFMIAVGLASVNLPPRIKSLTLLTLCLRVLITDIPF
jgi:hypothetical protein